MIFWIDGGEIKCVIKINFIVSFAFMFAGFDAGLIVSWDEVGERSGSRVPRQPPGPLCSLRVLHFLTSSLNRTTKRVEQGRGWLTEKQK